VLAKRVRPYFLLIKSRLLEGLGFVWCILVGSLIASRGFPQILPTALTILTTLAIALCVYMYNDITDTEMDKLNPNKKRRPLPSGQASAREAMNLAYLAGFAGVALALFLRFEILLICLVWLAWFLAYSEPRIRLKKRFLLKESTPPIGLFLSVIMGAIVNGSVSPTIIFVGMFSALFVFFGVPAFRDTTDIMEDRLFGVKSLATILDWKQRLEMVILFVLAIMTLTPLTYVNFGFNVIFPIVVVAMGLLALRFLFPLLDRLEEAKYTSALRLMTSYFFLSSISMVIGSFPVVF